MALQPRALGLSSVQAGAPVQANTNVPDGLQLGIDFPLVCETCLGPNPYVRMLKLPMAQRKCKISDRLYQPFRWQAGPGGRFKETIICFEVAMSKNVCQTCLVDMTFGVPVGVRDAVLNTGGGEAPTSAVNKEWHWAGKATELIENGGKMTGLSAEFGKMKETAKLLEVSSKINDKNGEGVAFRNLSKLCSFWLGGNCSRVLAGTCPYRPCNGQYKFPELASGQPEMCKKLMEDLEADGPVKVMKLLTSEVRGAIKLALSGNRDVAIRNRYYGTDDELSKKYLRNSKDKKDGTGSSNLEPPADQTISTIFIGNLNPGTLTESDLNDYFYQFGEIRSITIVARVKSAFIHYSSREAAERAMNKCGGSLELKGQQLRVLWGRAKGSSGAGGATRNNATREGIPVPGLPPVLNNGGPGSQNLAVSPAVPPGMPPPPPRVVAPPPGVLVPPHNPVGSGMPLPLPPGVIQQGLAPPPVFYPSQDPQRLGSGKIVTKRSNRHNPLGK